MPRRRQTNDATKSRRVLPDGTVIYVDPKTGRKIPGGSGSGPTQRGSKSLAQGKGAKVRKSAPAPKKKAQRKASGPKGFVPVAKGVGDIAHARKMAKKRADKRRGIKYIR